MKKFLLMLLGVLLALPSLARDFTYTYEGQTLTYTVLDEEAKTCETKAGYKSDYPAYTYYAGNGAIGRLIIPSVAKDGDIDYTVTKLGSYAFVSCDGLTSVVIPESVTCIGESAFVSCDGLTSVVIPESVTYIGNGAFSDCRGLTSAVILCSKIGSNVFENCTRITSVEIGSSVASISPYAFANCPNLTEISVDDQNKSYSTINGVLFDYDKTTIILYLPKSGTHYEIPNSVTTIGGGAFKGCSSLSSIEIPNSVTSIGGSAFSGCSSLSSIDIPNTVTTIGDYAFEDCSKITSINIPDSVTEIGVGAFDCCKRLKSIVLPDSIIKIDWYTFRVCTGLESAHLPEAVNSIGVSAFYGCDSLTRIIIPNSVTTIGKDAFSNCSGLKYVVVGKGVKSFVDTFGDKLVERVVFQNCKNIKKGAYPKAFSRIFEKSGASSIATCAYDPAISTVEDGMVIYPEGDTKIVLGFALAEGHFSVPDSITAIGDKAFANCDSLSSIIISPYVTEVGEDIFMGCDNLLKGAYPDAVENPFGEDVLAICFDAYDSVVENDFVYSRRKNALYFAPFDIESSFTVPETVTEITDNAFGLCSTLESVVLPEGLTKLGTKVWDGCPDIMHVVCKSAEPAAATRDLFQVGVYDKATLYVPKGSRAKYESAVPWKYFYNITEDEFNGLEEVEAEIGTIREEAGAEVFNLNGVRVATGGAEGLPAGIYIVRQGAKTEKIVVR